MPILRPARISEPNEHSRLMYTLYRWTPNLGWDTNGVFDSHTNKWRQHLYSKHFLSSWQRSMLNMVLFLHRHVTIMRDVEYWEFNKFEEGIYIWRSSTYTIEYFASLCRWCDCNEFSHSVNICTWYDIRKVMSLQRCDTHNHTQLLFH